MPELRQPRRDLQDTAAARRRPTHWACPFLGEIPIDPRVALAGDAGNADRRRRARLARRRRRSSTSARPVAKAVGAGDLMIDARNPSSRPSASSTSSWRPPGSGPRLLRAGAGRSPRHSTRTSFKVVAGWSSRAGTLFFRGAPSYALLPGWLPGPSSLESKSSSRSSPPLSDGERRRRHRVTRCSSGSWRSYEPWEGRPRRRRRAEGSWAGSPCRSSPSRPRWAGFGFRVSVHPSWGCFLGQFRQPRGERPDADLADLRLVLAPARLREEPTVWALGTAGPSVTPLERLHRRCRSSYDDLAARVVGRRASTAALPVIVASGWLRASQIPANSSTGS